MSLKDTLAMIHAASNNFMMNSIKLASVVDSGTSGPSHGGATETASESSAYSEKYDSKASDLDLTSLDSKVNRIEENILICIFLSVIVLGFFGNILVICTVLANKHMRTTSNLFILNLAISDIILCVFSIPFMTYKTLRHTWIFGEFLCRLAPFFQASNVLVSTMSITAIALDRYVNIVCAMKIRQTNLFFRSYGGTILCISIWLFAFVLSSPLFIVNGIESDPIMLNIDAIVSDDHIIFSQNSSSQDSNNYLFKNDSYALDSRLRRKQRSVAGAGSNAADHLVFNSISLNAISLNSNATPYQSSVMNSPAKPVDEEFTIDQMSPINIYHCAENWSSHYRLAFSYSLLLIQYIFPILIVGVAYGSIWWKLKKHRNKLKRHQQNNKSKVDRTKRNKVEEEPLNPTVVNQETAVFSDANQPGATTTGNNEVIVSLPAVAFSQSQSNVSVAVKRADSPTKIPYTKSAGSASPRLKHNTTAAGGAATSASQNENKRQRKMNILLAFIALIFAGSWLPLNIINILTDTYTNFIKPSHTFYIVNAICILFAMSSAVSNPFLYGFLNENFKREYVKLFKNLHERCFKCIGKKQLASATGTQSYVNTKVMGMMKTKVTSRSATAIDKV